MKRGTVALLGGVSACFLPTFQFAGSFRLGYLARLAAVLRRAGFPHPDRLTSGLLNRWCGDLLAIGKGEILVPGTELLFTALTLPSAKPAGLLSKLGVFSVNQGDPLALTLTARAGL